MALIQHNLKGIAAAMRGESDAQIRQRVAGRPMHAKHTFVCREIMIMVGGHRWVTCGGWFHIIGSACLIL